MAFLVEQYVRRLQVAVDEAFRVDIGEGRGQFLEPERGFRDGNRVFGIHELLERAAFHVIHHVVGDLAVEVGVQQGHDVRVLVQADEPLDFALEEKPVDPGLLGEDLDRDPLVVCAPATPFQTEANAPEPIGETST